MFWNMFYKLCTENNTKPLSVVKELKIASGIITKWKNGSIPNGETLIKLADYFGISIDYLLGRSETISTVPNSEYIELYSKLDENDKAEIRGEIKQMLKADKYRDSDNELIIHTPRKIAAHGADETKQINPSENPRKIT